MQKIDRTRRKRRYLVLSFFVPFGVMLLCFILGGLWPFGDRQVLAHDMWHQYYPFFVSFREKLRSGGSLQYLREAGMGIGYLPLYAYYLSSPLYLLSVLVPASLLREFFALLVLTKIGLAGLFFAVFLRTAFRRNEPALVPFSMMYALCSFVAGYYWNIIWLDALALLPLMLAGMVSLLREGRFRLYTLALALSLLCNYYLSFFCCIFVGLSFFVWCICRWDGERSLSNTTSVAPVLSSSVRTSCAFPSPMKLCGSGVWRFCSTFASQMPPAVSRRASSSSSDSSVAFSSGRKQSALRPTRMAFSALTRSFCCMTTSKILTGLPTAADRCGRRQELRIFPKKV